MNVIAVNIGNSLIEFGVFSNENLVFKANISSDNKKTSIEYAVLIKNIIEMKNMCCDSIGGAIVSSVVPIVGEEVCLAIKMIFGVDPMIVGSGVKTGLDIRLANAQGIGADFICNCVGCYDYEKYPAMIVDIGYVVTISVLDKDKILTGRTIQCGIDMQLQTLHEKTALLPSLSASKSENMLGRTVSDSVNIGVIYSVAGSINHTYRCLENFYDGISVFITGSQAQYVVDHLCMSFIEDRNLALKGLIKIFGKNS